jgi:hypothetical protein
MKHLKMLGLAAVAACALMAFVGSASASATSLTCGASVCPVGTVLHANSEGHATLHPIIGDIVCNSTVEGTISVAGNSTTTVKGTIPKTGLTFSNCTNKEIVTTLAGGTLELHTIGSSTTEGTVTSSGAEVTVEAYGFHCIFTTSNTDIGTFTGSSKTGGEATFDIGATIPRTGGRSGAFCGSSAQWTGSYKIDKPNPLNIH